MLIVPGRLHRALRSRAPLTLVIPVHLIAFTARASLPRRAGERPPLPSQLTEFYFWIALGGMMGGLFNTLVAPVLFRASIEYPLALVLACVAAAPPPQGESVAQSSSPGFRCSGIDGLGGGGARC